MKLLDVDSPLMNGLNKFADLIWLNFLTILCCIPIVTAGASFTAMHYMALKMARNEESYITRGFFKSFKENLRQSTIIWLVNLVMLFFLFGDFYIVYFSGVEFNIVFHVVVIFVAVLVALAMSFVYAVQAKFSNTIMRTIKNSLVISMSQLPKAVLYVLMNLVALFLAIRFIQILPLYLFFGLSYPAFAFAKLYSKFFAKLEDQIRASNPDLTPDPGAEDEGIFKDELEI